MTSDLLYKFYNNFKIEKTVQNINGIPLNQLNTKKVQRSNGLIKFDLMNSDEISRIFRAYSHQVKKFFFFKHFWFPFL
jgi:hypothetical protein